MSSQILVSRGVAAPRTTESETASRPPPTDRPPDNGIVIPLMDTATMNDGQSNAGLDQPADFGKVSETDANTGNQNNPSCSGKMTPPSMRLPTELLQDIFRHLSPRDFNAARHTCRFWFLASLNESLLKNALIGGGWWSSLSTMLPSANPNNEAPSHASSFDGVRRTLMSNCLSRECNLMNTKRSAFVEVGFTDFRGPLKGAMKFTVSLCGRFLMVVYGRYVDIFELNHQCPRGQETQPGPSCRRRGLPLGLARPVAKVICPRRAISCSMDTSSGRYSAAFLMEGRMGMVCDLTAGMTCDSSPEKFQTPGRKTDPNDQHSSPSPCICGQRPFDQAPLIVTKPESLYQSVCFEDDLPLSVAICPNRKCVAFGCSAGLELHWVDRASGNEYHRWFPLTSQSDYLYFLSLRRGIDTPSKLRLISSADGIKGSIHPTPSLLRGFTSTMLRAYRRGGPTMLTYTNPGLWQQPANLYWGNLTARPGFRSGFQESVLSQNVPRDSPLRTFSTASIDHYRAVPLSDGTHILFTDPHRRILCLGTDAPVGSQTRLLRKISFRPPPNAASPMPMLYSAGTDTRHGVRVVALFAMNDPPTGTDSVDASTASNRQMIMLYTVPPDLFNYVTQANRSRHQPPEYYGEQWHPHHGTNDSDTFTTSLRSSVVAPYEIAGHPVAICSNLTEIGLDSSSNLIIWAFSAKGWGKTWALDTGRKQRVLRSSVQMDGSIRRKDDAEDDIGLPEGLSDASPLDFKGLDGAEAGDPPAVSGDPDNVHYRLYEVKLRSPADRTIVVDIIHEASGITKVEIDLG